MILSLRQSSVYTRKKKPSLLQLFPSKCPKQCRGRMSSGWAGGTNPAGCCHLRQERTSVRAVPAPESPARCTARIPTSSPHPLPPFSLQAPASVTSRPPQLEITDSARVPEPVVYYPFLSCEEKCLEVGPGVLCRSSRSCRREDRIIAPMRVGNPLPPIPYFGALKNFTSAVGKEADSFLAAWGVRERPVPPAAPAKQMWAVVAP